jgi:tetratricopeptide (TPR) repeat protein
MARESRKCKAEFEAAVSLDPNDAANVEDMAGYLVQAPGFAGGDKKGADDLAAAIVKLDPAGGYLIQAAIASMENRQPGPFNQKAVEADPRNYAARLALAGYGMTGGRDLPQAEKHLRAALHLSPGRSRVYRQLAAPLVSQNRLDETAALLARAEAAIPGDLSPCFAAGNNIMMIHNIESAARRNVSQEIHR